MLKRRRSYRCSSCWVCIDPYIRPDTSAPCAPSSLVAQNLLEYRLAMGELIWLARTLTAICGHAIRPVILILFIRLICPEKPPGWAWVLAGVNAAVHTTALFSRFCFRIGPPNNYQCGPLSDLCLWVSLILMAYLTCLTIHSFHPRQPVLAVSAVAEGAPQAEPPQINQRCGLLSMLNIGEEDYAVFKDARHMIGDQLIREGCASMEPTNVPPPGEGPEPEGAKPIIVCYDTLDAMRMALNAGDIVSAQRVILEIE